MKKEKTTAIYITSWARYNEGIAGQWFALEDLTSENFKESMTAAGFEIDGFDEELTIHDYDDYDGIGLYELFGEAYPLTVIEFYEKWIDLDDDEQLAFIGIRETQSNNEALTALDNNELSDYMILTEDGFQEYCEECLSCGMDADAWDYIEKYIDWDSVYHEFAWDFSEFDHENENYYIREA